MTVAVYQCTHKEKVIYDKQSIGNPICPLRGISVRDFLSKNNVYIDEESVA